MLLNAATCLATLRKVEDSSTGALRCIDNDKDFHCTNAYERLKDIKSKRAAANKHIWVGGVGAK